MEIARGKTKTVASEAPGQGYGLLLVLGLHSRAVGARPGGEIETRELSVHGKLGGQLGREAGRLAGVVKGRKQEILGEVILRRVGVDGARELF